MPVVPSPPPEKPPDARRGTVFSLSFPPALHLFHIGMPLFYPSIRSSPSRFLARRFLFPSLSTPLVPAAYRAPRFSRRSSPPLPPFRRPCALAPASSRCCSRICHYATDITNPAHLSLLAPLLAPLLARALARSRWAAPLAALPRRVICNVSYARASPRSSAISAIILIFMPTPPPLSVASSHSLAFSLALGHRRCRARRKSQSKTNPLNTHSPKLLDISAC